MKKHLRQKACRNFTRSPQVREGRRGVGGELYCGESRLSFSQRGLLVDLHLAYRVRQSRVPRRKRFLYFEEDPDWDERDS